ncbi:hypothetical protein [Bartonella bovis]|uniref:hypothetical protein n=1 Tax=Bartonella bovis TaxID=155194 RepID=UPI001304BB68|nr:hypothetical protein [Bartonella bovis]
MKKVHITLKNKSFNGQRPLCKVPLVRAVSLGAVMAALLSGVSPVFASHLSSAGSKVQSVSAGAVSASIAHGRVKVVNGDRSCGVDQVVSRSSSRSGKKVSAKEQYKKLTKNQLSDGFGGYSFESSCGADASVNALKSASARSSVDLDVAASDWFLEENGVINWSDNTRSVNVMDTRVVGGQTRGTSMITRCTSKPDDDFSVCIGWGSNASPESFKGVALGVDSFTPQRVKVGAANGYDPITNTFSNKKGDVWVATYDPVSFGNSDAKITRQITGVAAGRENTDAVNVAQLKELRQWAEESTQSWNLRVGSWDTKIKDGDRIVFENSDGNIKISASQTGEESKILFNLSDDIKVNNSITVANKVKINEDGINLSGGKISHVGPGAISPSSTELINGAQFWEVKLKVNGFSDVISTVREDVTKLANGTNLALGGGANVLKGKQPVYTVQTKKYNGVEAAFKGVDSALTDLYEKLDQVEGGKDGGLVAQNSETKVITIGGSVEGNKISISNNKEEARKLTGLAAGDVSDKSTEAVTGKQLYEVNETVKGLTGDIEGVQGNVTTLTASLYHSD